MQQESLQGTAFRCGGAICAPVRLARTERKFSSLQDSKRKNKEPGGSEDGSGTTLAQFRLKIWRSMVATELWLQRDKPARGVKRKKETYAYALG